MFGLADHQMHVLRHDHVAINAHPEMQSHGFQAEGKQIVEPGVGKFRFSSIASEGDEVRLTGFVVRTTPRGIDRRYIDRCRSSVTPRRLGREPTTPRLASKRRTNLRVLRSKKWAHFDRRPAGDGGPAPPRECLVQISGFQHPKTGYVFLGLRVRPVGGEHVTIGLHPQRPRVVSRGKAAYENPDSGSPHFVIEHVNLAGHRLGFDGRVIVVGVVDGN